MQMKEIPGNLFSAGNVTYVQCISADIACGKGIAIMFNQHFDIKNRLSECFGNGILSRWDNEQHGFAVFEEPVINLITKRRYFEKPTEKTLQDALRDAARICEQSGIREIAMPYIASGLDRMDWKTQVRPAIEAAFTGMDINITVYSGKETI